VSWKSRCFIQNAIMIFLSLFKSFLWILIFLKCVHPAQSESYAEPIVFFRIVFLNLWGFVFWIPKQYILYISSAWWVNRCSVLCEWFFLFLFWRKKKKLIPATFTTTSWCQKCPCDISLMMSAKREMKFMLRQVGQACVLFIMATNCSHECLLEHVA